MSADGQQGHTHSWRVGKFIDGKLFKEVSPAEWIDHQVLWVCVCGTAKYVTYLPENFEPNPRAKQ